MTLEIKDIKNVAHLARIEMPEDQLEQYKKDLSDILDMANQLSEVNTDNVEPMTSAHQMNQRMRKDEQNDGGYPEQILSNAPEASEGYFLVPKVVE